MNTSGAWRKNKSAHKAKRVRHKPKIRWDQLGLSDPEVGTVPVSMEEIRKQVVALASHGFGQGTRSRSAPEKVRGRGPAELPASRRSQRRATT